MIEFSTTILKFNKNGDKTGWTYILVPSDVAEALKPNFKKSFRVKGKLDNYSIAGVALIPMGKGEFILPLNATIRKGIAKRVGAMLQVTLQLDLSEYQLDSDLVACLTDEKEASVAFYKMPRSHQNYYSKWIGSSKTDATKSKRIAGTIEAMLKNMTYPELLRSMRADK
jgi:hypothetical protein